MPCFVVADGRFVSASYASQLKSELLTVFTGRVTVPVNVGEARGAFRLTVVVNAVSPDTSACKAAAISPRVFNVPGAELIKLSIALVIAVFLSATSVDIAAEIDDVTSADLAIVVGTTAIFNLAAASKPAYPKAKSFSASITYPSKVLLSPLCKTYLLSAAAVVVYEARRYADKSSIDPLTAANLSVNVGFNADIALEFVKYKLEYKENVIVHCTGGVGRTGTFISSVLSSGLDTSKKLNMFKFIVICDYKFILIFQSVLINYY